MPRKKICEYELFRPFIVGDEIKSVKIDEPCPQKWSAEHRGTPGAADVRCTNGIWQRIFVSEHMGIHFQNFHEDVVIEDLNAGRREYVRHLIKYEWRDIWGIIQNDEERRCV